MNTEGKTKKIFPFIIFERVEREYICLPYLYALSRNKHTEFCLPSSATIET